MKFLVFSECGCAEVIEDGTIVDTVVFASEADATVLLAPETGDFVLAPISLLDL